VWGGPGQGEEGGGEVLWKPRRMGGGGTTLSPGLRTRVAGGSRGERKRGGATLGSVRALFNRLKRRKEPRRPESVKRGGGRQSNLLRESGRGETLPFFLKGGKPSAPWGGGVFGSWSEEKKKPARGRRIRKRTLPTGRKGFLLSRWGLHFL